MLTFLETRWPFVSVLLLLVLMAALLFLPSIANVVAIGVLISGLGMSLLFIVNHNCAPFARAEIIREKMNRKIIFEILALVLMIFLAGIASFCMGSYASDFVEFHWQGHGMVAGLIAAILVSFVVGFGVRWGMGKVTKLYKNRND